MKRTSLFSANAAAKDGGKNKTFSTKIMARGWVADCSEWSFPGAQYGPKVLLHYADILKARGHHPPWLFLKYAFIPPHTTFK